ncbi:MULTISPECIES: carbohydrate ABC transporter permease [Marinovum]|uniref:sn-glycerol-3-phosphate transport system permease protein UgpE n=2 Tax=Marinovum algicola TaxID=42444 RepID=A0A975W7I5_9RHOB|nr:MULTISPECIES: carbohydrate ABC transporter permease [Marinovum]MDD9745811.1 carbohydrate ABC transporter permease [Marinovum sp. PR37]SEI86115.1 carbohydrate ABC transporter membrane protein 2, CUT1 family [Marinovum algicola]SLN14988.1 Trehalose transport system permease protein SugB [Marinovum algicola]
MSMTDVHSAPRANHGADWDQIRRRAKSILVHGIVLALVGLMLLPLVYMVMMSFKTSTEIAQDPLGLPDSLYWGNYMAALSSMGYLRSVLNSLGITLSVIVVVVFAGAMAAYPLARLENRISRVIVMVMALGLATPNFVTITPIYVIFRDLGLLDSYLGIVLAFAALKLPLAVFFYTSFIAAIPIELEEAARLDNCNNWQIFWHVIRPLLAPVTATLSLFVMIMVWNDFIYPLLLLTDKDKLTVMIAVYKFVGNTGIDPTKLFPAAVLGSLPLLIMFALFQRKIMAGATAGAVK